MKLLNYYYEKVGNQDVLGLVKKLGINIHWIVEAGCHDGTDTVLMNASLCPSQIFAFEPDPDSFNRAEALFRENLNNVRLFPFGLSSENVELFLNFPNGQIGTGSTMLSTDGDKSVLVKRFDDVVTNLQDGGLLWLDVEGHAVQALSGASQMLPRLSVAKVEIQMHGMNKIRSSDFLQVSKIMRTSGLWPVHAPIHPGFFGDILFVNTKFLTPMRKLYSRILSLEMILLHKIIYPSLGKPKNPV